MSSPRAPIEAGTEQRSQHMSEIMEARLAHLPDEEIEAPSDEGLIQHPQHSRAKVLAQRPAVPCPRPCDCRAPGLLHIAGLGGVCHGSPEPVRK